MNDQRRKYYGFRTIGYLSFGSVTFLLLVMFSFVQIEYFNQFATTLLQTRILLDGGEEQEQVKNDNHGAFSWDPTNSTIRRQESLKTRKSPPPPRLFFLGSTAMGVWFKGYNQPLNKQQQHLKDGGKRAGEGENSTQVTVVLLDYHHNREHLSGWANTQVYEAKLRNYPISTHETDCETRISSQTSSEPRQNCNMFHETDFVGGMMTQHIHILGNGNWRQGFKLDIDEDYKHHHDHIISTGISNQTSNAATTTTSVLFKTLRFKVKDFNDETTRRAYLDGRVSERVSRARRVINNYGFCAHSSMIEIASEGDLESMIQKNKQKKNVLSPTQKLLAALDMAWGVAEVHYGPSKALRFYKENYDSRIQQPIGSRRRNISMEAEVAILDIKPDHMMLMKDGTVKVADFNNAELLQRNITAVQNHNTNHSTLCDFRVMATTSEYKSPEEMKNGPLSEKADIYSLGSIFFLLFTEHYPYYYDLGDYFHDKTWYSQMKTMLMNCVPPKLPWRLQTISKTKNNNGNGRVIDEERHYYSENRNNASKNATMRQTTLSDQEANIERGMIQIIQSCHTCNERDRPSALDIVFDLVSILQNFTSHKSWLP